MITPQQDSKPAVSAAKEAPSVEVIAAKQPEGLTVEEERQIQQTVAAAIQELATAKGSQLEETTDKLANVGYKAQERVSINTKLEQENLGRLMEDNDAFTTGVKGEIERLDDSLRRFAREGSEENFLVKLISRIPVIGARVAKWLRNEGRRRQTIAEFSQSVEQRLQEGRGGLQQDNAELLVVLKTYERMQTEIGRNAYAAELLAMGVQQLAEQTKDAVKQNALRNVLFHVVTRARDLRAFELMYQEYFVGISLARDANKLLTAILTRLITMGVPALTLGLVMRAALVRQKEGIEAAKQTRDTISNILLSTAQMLRDHARSIGDFYKEGALDLKKAEDAAKILTETLTEMDRIKADAIPAAREQLAKAKKLTAELRERMAGTRAADVASLEISELPTRPTEGAERPKL